MLDFRTLDEEVEDNLRSKYFIQLKPLDAESEKILEEKKYKNEKSVAKIWLESFDE